MTQTHQTSLSAPVGPAAPTAAAAVPIAAYRRVLDQIFTVLVVAFLGAVVVQFLLAGLGTFHHRGEPGPGFGPHETLGNILGITAGVIFVIALVAHISWRVVVCSLVMGLLTETAQHALAHFGWNHQWLGALHAMDGAVIAVLAVGLAYTAVRRQAERR